MAELNKMLQSVISTGGSKIKMNFDKVFGGISTNTEWVKWLSYEPLHEKERINFLESKKVNLLTTEELYEVIKYRKFNDMLSIFKKLELGIATLDEELKAIKFITEYKIEDVMISKLTRDEMEIVKLKIKAVNEQSANIVSQLIKAGEDEEIYMSLSAVDAYVLHAISKININSSVKKINDEIYGPQDNGFSFFRRK